ncbi:MAG: DUF4906 domain-containing protein, partial [Dysgonomonas sp.]|nr:DUF4906 domain-containing protein [Dysgonomonas sp.]
ATHPEFTATYKVYLGADNSQNYNVKRNCQYTYTIILKDIVNVDSRVEVTPGSQIAPQAESNCYIVPPNSSIYIPVSRANKSGVGEQIDAVSNDWTVEVIWQTSPDMLTLTTNQATRKKGCFKVTTNATLGNAIIAARRITDNKIVWSWHIWMANYDPDQVVNQNKINNATFMSWNLGAISGVKNNIGNRGLYYQYGRKDPFPGTDGITSSVTKVYYDGNNNTITNVPVGSNATILSSIQNPSVFYLAPNTTYDWLTVPNDYLWNNNGSKTAYDPCPSGWKVPPSSVFVPIPTFAWDGTNLGINNATAGWFPAAGWRVADGITFFYVGGLGGYWTSTASATSTLYFIFDASAPNISPMPRVNAVSVRCIKE